MAEDAKLDIENKEEVISWLRDISRGSGDAIPLWKAVTPKVEEFVDYELHPEIDSHKLWPQLNPSYLLWKIGAKGVSGIGYLEGDMREAASKKAVKTYKPKTLLWKLNTGYKRVKDYVYRFHFGFEGEDSLGRFVKQPERPIYKYTYIRVSNFLKLDAKNFSDGSRHANFTYNWLKKSLEKGYKKK